MQQQEAQSNSVAARRGWEQLRARKTVDNASELDSAGTTGEPATEGRSRASARADGMRTPSSHEITGGPRSVSVVGDRMSAQVAARNTGDPSGKRAGVHAQESRRTAPLGSQSVQSSASNAGVREKSAPVRCRRRVTTAGAKGRRKM